MKSNLSKILFTKGGFKGLKSTGIFKCFSTNSKISDKFHEIYVKELEKLKTQR